MEKKHLLVAAGLGLAQLALLSTAGRAQSAPPKTDSVKSLNEVVVTASRSPKKADEIGRVVTVISADQIARSQGKSLPQLLNAVAGITFSGANNVPGISSDVYLRGALPGNTLILIDGFAVNNASSIDGSYDLNVLSLDQIDHIEILKGSGSTLYGSDAVAGVINVITKHARSQGLKTNLQLGGGSYKTFKEGIGLLGNVQKTGISLNLSNTDSKGFPAATDSTGTKYFKNDGYHQRSASLNLTQYVSDKFSLIGNFQGSYNTGDLPDGAFADDKNYTYQNTFLFAGIGAKFKLPGGSMLVNLSQNNVINKYNEQPSPDNYSTTYITKNVGHIDNGEIVFNQTINQNFDLSSGAGFKYTSTNQYSDYNGSETYLKPDSAHSSIFSTFASLFFKSGIFHLELGERYNHHSRYGDNFTYTINPSVLIAHQLKLFGTIASAFKSPSLYQLYSQYGTPGLKPETTTSYEAGFDWQIIENALSFNTVFYRRKTTDVIYFYTNPLTYNSNYKNGALEDDKGFESEVKTKQGRMEESFYFAHVTGTQTDASGVETKGLLRRPINTFGATLSYPVTTAFSFDLQYKYTGQRTDNNYNLPVPPYYYVVKLDAYSLVDLHLNFEASKALTFYVDIDNLFNAKYVDWLGYNTRGFNTFAGLKWSIN